MINRGSTEALHRTENAAIYRNKTNQQKKYVQVVIELSVPIRCRSTAVINSFITVNSPELYCIGINDCMRIYTGDLYALLCLGVTKVWQILYQPTNKSKGMETVMFASAHKLSSLLFTCSGPHPKLRNKSSHLSTGFKLPPYKSRA